MIQGIAPVAQPASMDLTAFRRALDPSSREASAAEKATASAAATRTETAPNGAPGKTAEVKKTETVQAANTDVAVSRADDRGVARVERAAPRGDLPKGEPAPAARSESIVQALIQSANAAAAAAERSARASEAAAKEAVSEAARAAARQAADRFTESLTALRFDA